MIRLLCIILLLISLPAQATPLVADLSNYRIDIDARFSGTKLFLFGARAENGDIVVVVRGPAKNYVLHKKEEIGGIWVNRDRMKLFGIPNFYAIASSKPLGEINAGALFAQLGIGQNQLLTPPSDLSQMARFNAFEEAFLTHHNRSRLYSINPEPIGFMGETLFKTTIEFPDNIPPGEYMAEIYLISDGEVIGMQSTPINVVKSGLDAFVYQFAHHSPALYGLCAIILAMTAGWLGSRLFELKA